MIILLYIVNMRVVRILLSGEPTARAESDFHVKLYKLSDTFMPIAIKSAHGRIPFEEA
jgi:hypothetical protein